MKTGIPCSAAAAALLLFAACAPHAEEHEHTHAEAETHDNHEPHEEADHEHGAAEGLVKFSADRGLSLPPEVESSLSLEVRPVVRGDLIAEKRITGQVIASAGGASLLARQPSDEARRLQEAQFENARLARIDESPVAATGFADLLFDSTQEGLKTGDFLTLTARIEAKHTLVAPLSALLDGAEGTHVYLKSHDNYRRVKVRPGLRSHDSVELLEGVVEGDLLVVRGADQLWLAELRLTKGGGHSH